MKRLLLLGFWLAFHTSAVFAQRDVAGSTRIRLELEKLANTGRVLMIAAHPDDENTALLAYLARGRHVRTAYLALNRGEGGQNLIGPEQGAEIGLIRTQELLAARRIDGAEQFFTRAIDFGFSKTAKETEAVWTKQPVLADVVWIIRSFQPDVIVNRFSGTPRDGHGNHQLSAILSKEAFAAAADPTQFPEQLKYVKPWQTKRLFWNYFNFRNFEEKPEGTTIGYDLGQYDPVLGYSYNEIAGMSRTMHKSQAMGTAERKGSFNNYLSLLAGAPAKSDLLEDVNTSWGRYVNGNDIAILLDQAIKSFSDSNPAATIPALVKVRQMILNLPDKSTHSRVAEVDELIAQCAGLFLDATADRFAITPGDSLAVKLQWVDRSDVAATIAGAALNGKALTLTSGEMPKNKLTATELTYTVPASMPISQPYWLAEKGNGALYRIDDQQLIGRPENAPSLVVEYQIAVGGTTISVRRPLLYRTVDRVDGEKSRLVLVVPPVSVSLAEPLALFPTPDGRSVSVTITANRKQLSGEARLALPAGWRSEPVSRPFSLETEGASATVTFTVTPPAGSSRGELIAQAVIDGQTYSHTERAITYRHIPPIVYFPEASAHLLREDVKLSVKRVGYVMGAGDDVPMAISQMGAEVTLLEPKDLATGDLSKYDTIVAGVRAFNRREDLRANMPRILKFVEDGGTFVAQYNTLDDGYGVKDTKAGPYPFSISRDRVTVEGSPVSFDASSPLMSSPNRIAAADFDGWVQERALYFPANVDPRYKTVMTLVDPDEKPSATSTIYTPYGKGMYIYTTLVFFRELPAAVPGAFHLFANFLSASHQ